MSARDQDGGEMRQLVQAAAVDPMLRSLHPIVIEPTGLSHPAEWRLAWIAWQEARGFASDLVAPPAHYKPNPYWSPTQIRLWTYNRAALLLTEQSDHRHEADLHLRQLGLREVPA